jgi:Methyltransferase domain
MRSSSHVHYGCGLAAPADWTNFDASPTLRLERLPFIGRVAVGRGGIFPPNVLFGDIVKGLPVPAHSSAAVYCSHVLEHLSLNDFRTALRNTWSLLRESGIFRLVVPDLRIAAQRYLAAESADAARRFMTDTGLGIVDRPRGIGGLLRGWLGNSRHLWMWDFNSLRHELEQAGFVDIRQARFGDSEDSMFAAVEDESRWADAVGIQCYAS